ncbi:TPA: hypothetical protein ACRNT8_006482, partial [Pseudomonas aeruginosa]
PEKRAGFTMNGKSPETANTRPPEHFPVRFLGFSVRFSVVCVHVLDFPVFFQERKIAGNSKYAGSRAFSGQVFLYDAASGIKPLHDLGPPSRI